MSAALRVIATVLASDELAKHVIAALNEAGYVCVPREPSEEMRNAAYWSALAENAVGVWEDMIEASVISE
jgi:hypothetical protein